jgi:hypothetical protein
MSGKVRIYVIGIALLTTMVVVWLIGGVFFFLKVFPEVHMVVSSSCIELHKSRHVADTKHYFSRMWRKATKSISTQTRIKPLPQIETQVEHTIPDQQKVIIWGAHHKT